MENKLTTQDVTESMLCFRDAAVHIWNSYLRLSENPMSEDIQMSRDRIELELIRALVFSPFDRSSKADNYRSGPLKDIIVRPNDQLNEIPMQVGHRERNGNTLWSDVIICQLSDFPNLSFIDFFDWYPYGHIDMALVRTTNFDEDQFYLIENRFCRFVLNTSI